MSYFPLAFLALATASYIMQFGRAFKVIAGFVVKMFGWPLLGSFSFQPFEVKSFFCQIDEDMLLEIDDIYGIPVFTYDEAV